jgi:hypothetical protein
VNADRISCLERDVPAEPREFDVLQLADEPQLEEWARYAEEADRIGAFRALTAVFPQLRYPIRKGISETDGYHAAARSGAEPDGEATGLFLAAPDRVRLEIAPTIAGRIPILVVEERADFEALVRAFSERNVPVDVPASMGACLVRGLNDWDRVGAYRREWESRNPFGDWSAEFRALVPRKELCQDRFMILSRPGGPYRFSEDEWRPLSLSIRREHEATHYLTLRVAGAMRDSLVDELVADYVGLVRTFGGIARSSLSSSSASRTSRGTARARACRTTEERFQMGRSRRRREWPTEP